MAEISRKITNVDDRLFAYLQTTQPPEHEQLQMLRERTRSMPDGIMQITPEQGHLLAFLVRLIAARRTLEIGTFTGYSALAVALALPADGQVVACDISEEWTSIGRGYWAKAGVADKIDLRIGNAVDVLSELEQRGEVDRFDLAFIDADKESYDAYYKSALRLVRPDGLILLDNTLRRGRVADPTQTDPDMTSLRRLNAKIAHDGRVDHVLLTIASGMTFVRRRPVGRPM